MPREDLEFNELKEIMSGRSSMKDLDKKIESAIKSKRSLKEARKQEVIDAMSTSEKKKKSKKD